MYYTIEPILALACLQAFLCFCCKPVLTGPYAGPLYHGYLAPLSSLHWWQAESTGIS